MEHTLAVCPAWAESRCVLVEAIGGDELSRPALVQAMVRSEREWETVASFCEAVMLEKEVAGRLRQRASRSSRRGRAPGVGSRETTPGHGRRGSEDGKQWVAHRPYVYF